MNTQNIQILRGARRFLKTRLEDRQLLAKGGGLMSIQKEPGSRPQISEELPREITYACGLLLVAVTGFQLDNFHRDGESFLGLRLSFAEARNEAMDGRLPVDSPLILPTFCALPFSLSDFPRIAEADEEKWEEIYSDGDGYREALELFDRLARQEIGELIEETDQLLALLDSFIALGQDPL
jgi:hypothetical protein